VFIKSDIITKQSHQELSIVGNIFSEKEAANQCSKRLKVSLDLIKFYGVYHVWVRMHIIYKLNV
jgi:hypothetical protein